eukprot:29192-Pelagococcus_subviridis.AAC.4
MISRSPSGGDVAARSTRSSTTAALRDAHRTRISTRRDVPAARANANDRDVHGPARAPAKRATARARIGGGRPPRISSR